MTVNKLVIAHPAAGIAPSGFPKLHVELLPNEVGHMVSYDPRVLNPKSKRADVPSNVAEAIVQLQSKVQRSIDKTRVSEMVAYLDNAVAGQKFANWAAIELVTISKPDLSELESRGVASLDVDADYFIADGQHRYCAILDFVQKYPEHANKFTQGITISSFPEDKFVEWAGQQFHDLNYFSVPVRAGKALAVDTRDPINALTKELGEHEAILKAGGIAYERDTPLKNDTRFTSHTILHRFVRGFVFGRSGLDKGINTNIDIDPVTKNALHEYVNALTQVMPWVRAPEDREAYLTRASVVLSSLGVIGHDLYNFDPTISTEQKAKKISLLGKINWKRTNLKLVGIVGSEKEGQVQPGSSRQSIDSTIRFLREKLDLFPPDQDDEEENEDQEEEKQEKRSKKKG